MDRLKDKVAFITGGARGQGRAIAQKFASEGADIVLADICADIPSVGYHFGTVEDLRETQASVEALDRRCIAEVADVRDQAAMDAVVAKAIETFGKIDITIAQAGIADYKPLWEISEQEWQDCIDVNLTGAWHALKAVAPHHIERQSGAIVFTSSVKGIEGGVCGRLIVAAGHGSSVK